MSAIYWAGILLMVAFVIGQWIEKRHYRHILRREEMLNNIPCTNTKALPDGNFRTRLVGGSVTISIDHFKRFLATLHAFFGGRVTSYETLLDRARREALLRLKSQAHQAGAQLVLNVRYETCSIYKGNGKTIGSVEVLAYGTALMPPKVSDL